MKLQHKTATTDLKNEAAAECSIGAGDKRPMRGGDLINTCINHSVAISISSLLFGESPRRSAKRLIRAAWPISEILQITNVSSDSSLKVWAGRHCSLETPIAGV